MYPATKRILTTTIRTDRLGNKKDSPKKNNSTSLPALTVSDRMMHEEEVQITTEIEKESANAELAKLEEDLEKVGRLDL